MLTACRNPDFIAQQAELVRKCIMEHKWYLSEKAGHDVGWTYAEHHFVRTYLPGFAVGFRATFCGLVCFRRAICPLNHRYQASVA
jgi:hypothetical protein